MSSISSENIRTAVDLVTHADLRVTAHEIAEQAWGELQDAGCTDEEIHKITWENASKLFRHPVPESMRNECM